MAAPLVRKSRVRAGHGAERVAHPFTGIASPVIPQELSLAKCTTHKYLKTATK
jgi:hypothetical protein